MEQTVNLPGIGIKPLLSLKRHYRVSIILSFLVLVIGMPVVWIKGQSLYSAEAVFQVAPRYMKNLESDAEVELQSNSQYREFVNHLQNTVTRYDVLERALASLQAKGIDTRPPALTQREYIERLQKVIVTRAIPDTYMVRVRLDGLAAEKAHLHEVVNAVMISFMETSKAEQIYGSAERYNVLKDNERKLRQEVAEMDVKRSQLAERLGLTTFLAGTVNPYDSLLSDLRTKLANSEVERKQAEATYQAFNDRREIPADLGRSLLEMRLGDLSLVTLRTETNKRIEELSQKISGLAEKHPARAPAEAEIKELRDRLRKAEADFDSKNFDNYHSRLAATLQQRRAVEQGIRRNVSDMESQASEYAQLFQQAMQLTRAIDENNARLEQIDKRVNYLETESNALGFVRLVTPALPAEMPMGIGKTKLLLVLIIVSFGVALGVPVILDMLDRRIRSVNEAEKLLGIPAAGWQIRREDLPTNMYSEEQSRRFAATLMRTRSRSQRNVYAFTSVKALGGTTTTLLDTARTLVQLGASVLVVEANAFTPFAGFSKFRPGLSELLRDDLDANELAQPYTHQDTAIDVIGMGSHAGTGLQRLDRLRRAIRQWEERYEYVLFDLPPILVNADAEMLIEVLGQVFLVVEAEAVNRGEISRAKRLLQKIDPEAVGLFVNGVPLFRGSGYMEQNIIENLTRVPMSKFLSRTDLSLRWEMLRTQWSLNRGAILRGPFPWLKRGRRDVPQT